MTSLMSFGLELFREGVMDVEFGFPFYWQQVLTLISFRIDSLTRSNANIFIDNLIKFSVEFLGFGDC